MDDQPQYSLWNLPSDKWHSLPEDKDLTLKYVEESGVEIPGLFIKKVSQFLKGRREVYEK